MANPKYFIIQGWSTAITPSDTVDVDFKWSDGWQIDAPGALTLMFKDGSSRTWNNLVKFDHGFGDIKRVMSTGTTVAAGNIYLFSVGIQ